MARPSKYPPEFREQAVELVRASDKTVAAVARELGINDTTLGNWVKADQAERGVPDATGLLPLTAAERAELTKLRRENAKLRVEREILKKAALESRGQCNTLDDSLGGVAWPRSEGRGCCRTGVSLSGRCGGSGSRSVRSPARWGHRRGRSSRSCCPTAGSIRLRNAGGPGR
ncbi:MAG: transposase [Chloroflexi bacterium]|nr:transposase [Chloroflexota bacterium]